ncbi:MAG: hypothetical protein AABX84_00310, partial [Nanoarchaeota archaeon]
MGKKNKGSKEKLSQKEMLINSAAQIGIGEIIRHHPRFKNIGNYIAKHIDPNSVNKRLHQLYDFAKKREIPKEEMEDYLAEGIA